MKVLALLLIAMLAVSVQATVFTAASTSASDVQTAINSLSASGDIAQIPTGTNTWTTQVTVSVPAGKTFILRGMGGGYTGSSSGGFGSGNFATTTVITNGIDIFTSELSINIAPTGIMIVSNLDFATIFSNQNGNMFLGNSSTHLPNFAFRISGCKFYVTPLTISNNIGTRAIEFTPVYGVMDNCYFRKSGINNGCHAFDIGPDGARLLSTNWHTAQVFADTNTVVIETSTFDFDDTGDNIMDSYSGSKFVLRYCVATNSFPGCHGADSDARGVRMWEIYKNFFYSRNSYTPSPGTTFHCRSGTGVFWGNTADAAWNGLPPVYFRELRATAGYPAFGNQTDFLPAGGLQGAMNGSQIVDGNFQGNGYPGLDQVGRGSFSVNPVVWTATFTTNNYEALSPCYLWNNNINGNTSPTASTGDNNNSPIPTIIHAGYDYYDNTQKPGYSPLIYPHPFIGGGTDPAISVQPTSLGVFTGQPATFTVAASGGSTLSYQWTFNGVNVGSNASTYTRSNCRLADNGGIVQVSVTDLAGTLVSTAVTLSVSINQNIQIGAGVKFGAGVTIK